jgi:single-strand DNA-binding protein
MTKNQMQVIGFAGSDPVVFKTKAGQTGARFSVATTERWKDRKGERHERTEWHRVVLWGPVAELAAKAVKKGSHVGVQGPLHSSEYQDQKSGATQRSWEIVADELLLLDRAEKAPEGEREAGEEEGENT